MALCILSLFAVLGYTCAAVVAIASTGGCLLPELRNVISRARHDLVVRSGSYIANDTKLTFDCPAQHWLTGSTENTCRDSQWLIEFPYCLSYGEYIYPRVLIAFCLLISILILMIYWALKSPPRWQPHKFCIMEPHNETPVSSMTNVSQL